MSKNSCRSHGMRLVADLGSVGFVFVRLVADTLPV